MVNPIAIIMIALGILLFLSGILLAVRRAKVAGIVISLLGLGAVAIPFVISFYLGSNP
jgi:hypothetical protein